MTKIFNFFQQFNHENSKRFIVEMFNFLVSLLIILTIGILIYFAGFKVYTLLAFPHSEHFIHDMVFILVLVKIYRLLIAYLQFHHVGIKYIVEISIIAPAIEIIFASDNHSLLNLTLLGIFGLGNLLVYIFFYDKISKTVKD